jgi:hypothetical protein
MHTVLWGGNAEHPIAWAKAWCDVMGMKGGRVRAPGANLEPEVKAEFQRRIRETLQETRSDPVFSSAPFLEEPVAAAPGQHLR